MGEVQFRRDLYPMTRAHPDRRACPLPHSVHCQYGGFLKRRRIERGGCVGLVVLREKDGSLESQFFLYPVAHPEFLFEPEGHG